MFEYSIQKIVNGWLLTIVTPDQILAEKVHYVTEYQAWFALSEIVNERVKLLE